MSGLELACEWEKCGSQHEPRALMRHITEVHSHPGDLQCLWEGCGQMEANHYALINHIRSHVKYCPFTCFVTDCDEEFPNADQLQVHLKARHEEHKDNKLSWFTFLDQFRYSSPLLNAPPPKKFSKISDREFNRMLNSRKIDFLKISNVTADDIVSEPSRKKGRTANAEINAELREQYRADNSAFKTQIMEQATRTFEDAQTLEPLPRDEEIDKLSREELVNLYADLERKYVWSLEVHELLKEQLEDVERQRDTLINDKELLLDASIALEIKGDESLYKLE